MPLTLIKEKIKSKKKYQELYSDTVEERIAILKRLREMLLAQREKFRNYLNLLEKEEEAILNEDTEKIEVHIQVEHSVLKEIFSFQKVIEPLEELYRINFPQNEDTVPELRKSLDNLKEKVLKHNENNRNLLKQKIEHLRLEIKSVKKNHKTQSPFARAARPSIIDITT